MPEAILRIAGDDVRPLPKRINLTKTAVEQAVTPPGKDRIIIYDAKVPALALRVTSKGAKSFILYRKFRGQPVKMLLGKFPDITVELARNLAVKENAKVIQGIDPREDRRSIRTSITLRQLFDRYTKEHAEVRDTERTRITDKSRFDTCFASWETRKVATIRPADVRDIHAHIAKKRGNITSNRAVQLLRRLFNWAKIVPNPAAKGTVDYFKEQQRDRFMEAGEIPKFFKALEAEPNTTIRDFVKVSLWTGARRSNVQSMRWDEINFDTSTWTVPASKSKSGEAMKLHLSPPAVAVLESRKGNGSNFVFPGPGKSGHIADPKSGWKRILTAAEIKDFRLHDLRRTLGSWQAATGASLPVIGKSLGHHDVATTAIYARLNLDPVRASVDTAAAAIIAAMTPKKAKAKKKR